VIIASGGSGALEIAITGLLNEGDGLLIPRPGFSLYQVRTEHHPPLPGVSEKAFFWMADGEFELTHVSNR
jgi:histidinol-phosphate/aromatic aminotransferase/cobyric acid decarboxylase-like protein